MEEEDGKKRLKHTGNESIDRISTLSQDIIHSHIFTHLDDKDIKIMSSLSNTWYRLSNSFPYLDFNLSSLAKQMLNDYGTPNQQDHLIKFLTYVDQTLNRFHDLNSNQIIHTFNIPFKFKSENARLLDKWIHLVLQHGVKVFTLFITNPPLPNSHQSMACYDLPPIFFSHPNSITKVARLHGCSLLRSFLVPNLHPNLLLIKLYLCQVLMDETVLSYLISCCPLIQELFIGHCMGIVKCLRISHLHKLKYLHIHDEGGEVEIDLPSLQRLSLIGRFKVRIIGDCPLLTYLNLFSIQELELPDLLSRLPLLHTLYLSYVYCLTKLKVSSHNLKKLEVISCPNLVQLNIDDAPSLLSVVFTSDSALPPDLLVSSSSSSVHYNVTLSYTTSTIEEFLFHLSSFVSKINNVEVLNLNLKKSVENISLEELKEVVDQPPVDSVHNLKIFFGREMKENHLLVLDGLLWTCRPHNLSIPFGMNNLNNYIVKKILEIIRMGRGDGGYRFFKRAGRRWLHHIVDVLHVTREGTETKLIIDATSRVSKIYSNILSKNATFLIQPPYPEIKFIFKW